MFRPETILKTGLNRKALCVGNKLNIIKSLKMEVKMWQKKIKLIVFFLIVIGLSGIQAQDVINTSGGNATGNGGSASYSVGQVVYTTYTSTNGSVAQGVQQPFEISVVTGLEEANGINLQCSAYPNPTTDYLTLEVKDFNLSSLTFQLFDMSGKLLETIKIAGNQTSIVMSNLLPATYFLKITDNKKEIKTFKIIKTNKKY